MRDSDTYKQRGRLPSLNIHAARQRDMERESHRDRRAERKRERERERERQ